MANSPIGQFQKPEDRRKSDRRTVADRHPITAMAGGKVYTCFIEDISPHGLRLSFEGAMPEGNVIALDHPIAGTLCGVCAWRDEANMGIDLQFPDGELERILRCICLVL
ncbi:MAG: PilZ domain-containing protein [Alphaproteobacteria bacterium]